MFGDNINFLGIFHLQVTHYIRAIPLASSYLCNRKAIASLKSVIMQTVADLLIT